MFLSRAEILAAVRQSGMADSVVCLHSSLKSFGRVEGGADAVIDAFVDAGCTLIVPTFTYECQIPPPPGRSIPRNGTSPKWIVERDKAEAYIPEDNRISGDMGAIPARILERPDRIRGNHPLNSFAGLGPRAAGLIAAQAPLNVYGPLKQMYLSPPAFLVLAGVNLTKATAIHFAEERSGRRLFRRWALLSGAADIEVEEGSCSEGFENLAPAVSGLEKRVQVGASLWRIYPFQEFVDAIVSAILQDPPITHCPDKDCARCNDAVRGGPLFSDDRVRKGEG
jgi:aminoglycoside N3'-acetyltransferase